MIRFSCQFLKHFNSSWLQMFKDPCCQLDPGRRSPVHDNISLSSPVFSSSTCIRQDTVPLERHSINLQCFVTFSMLLNSCDTLHNVTEKTASKPTQSHAIGSFSEFKFIFSLSQISSPKSCKNSYLLSQSLMSMLDIHMALWRVETCTNYPRHSPHLCNSVS